VSTPSARDAGLRRVSTVTKVVAGVGIAVAVAFAVHAADDHPGRSNTSTSSDVSTRNVPAAHTSTGGS
jgi:hypothetical protein